MNHFKSKAALVIAAALAASQSFAAVTTIDTSEPVAQVAEGASGAGVIGLAVLAFVILIGILVKMRRAGS